jgi:hypothetical protein
MFGPRRRMSGEEASLSGIKYPVSIVSVFHRSVVSLEVVAGHPFRIRPRAFYGEHEETPLLRRIA